MELRLRRSARFSASNVEMDFGDMATAGEQV